MCVLLLNTRKMTENPTDDKEISSSENEGVELDSDEEVKKKSISRN